MERINQSAFGNYAPALEAPRPRDRIREALSNPELHDRAERFARGAGKSALLGAAEGSNLFRIDKDGKMKVKKRRVVMAALRPTHTLRKAAVGAASGGMNGLKTAAMNEAIAVGRDIVQGYGNQASPSTEAFPRVSPDLWQPSPELPPLAQQNADPFAPSEKFTPGYKGDDPFKPSIDQTWQPAPAQPQSNVDPFAASNKPVSSPDHDPFRGW